MTEQKVKFKAFDLYDMEEIEVKDIALKSYINLEGKLVLKSYGRHTEKFGNAKVHILERLAMRVGVPGHIGKKHKIITNWATGKYSPNMKIVLQAMEIIQKKKNGNPVQVLVKAIETCSPRDEITTIEYGGARYAKAVDVAPQRRIDLALRYMTQGAYTKSFNKKTKIEDALAEEIITAYQCSGKSTAVAKKRDLERQASSSNK